MLKNQKGFTLIELIMIIVILGILAALAIPRYIDLRQDAANATARGVLGSLRGANSILFSSRVVGNTSGTYTMGDITSQADLQGITYVAPAATQFTITVGSDTYRFDLASTVSVPTTPRTISCGATSYSGGCTNW